MNNDLLTSLCVIAICISIGAIVYTSYTRINTDDWELRVQDLKDHADFLADELTKCQDFCKNLQKDLHHIDVNQLKNTSRLDSIDAILKKPLKPVAMPKKSKAKTNK